MRRSLKRWFVIHAVVSLLFGLGLYFYPARLGGLVGWTDVDVMMSRMYGASLLALSAGSALAYSAHTWDEVRVKVALEAVFCSLSAAIGLYGVLFEDAPRFVWLYVGLMDVFAVVWAYYLVQQRAASRVAPPTANGPLGKPVA